MGWGTSINNGTRAFRSKTMLIFFVFVDTSNATPCERSWFNAPKIGGGDRYGAGYRNRGPTRSCFHPGPYRDCQAGCRGLTGHSVIANRTLCVCQRNEDDPWELSDGSNRPSRNSIWNQRSAPAVANAFILFPNHKSKRPDPFDSKPCAHICQRQNFR